jgi:hypothetical protein
MSKVQMLDASGNTSGTYRDCGESSRSLTFALFASQASGILYIVTFSFLDFFGGFVFCLLFTFNFKRHLICRCVHPNAVTFRQVGTTIQCVYELTFTYRRPWLLHHRVSPSRSCLDARSICSRLDAVVHESSYIVAFIAFI